MNTLNGSALYDCQKLDELISKTQTAIDNAPEGTLRICQRNGRTYYYHRLSGSKETAVYIRKENLNLARRLAQKDYDMKLLKNLINRRAALEKLSSEFPKQSIDDIYENLSDKRRFLVTPIRPTDAQYTAAWLDKPYSGLAFREDDKSRFFTDKGERVRSKSEIIIANTLARCNIPYKYECPLTLEGRTIYPDFTILDIKKRKVVYFEHFGRMDDPEYANDFVRKINFYEANKIFPGESLIMTFESSRIALDTAVVNMCLKHCLL